MPVVNSVDGMGTPRTPKSRTKEVARRLAETYPDAVCELDHTNAFELLAATILSAQTTDFRVNIVTPELFRRYPTPADLAAAMSRPFGESSGDASPVCDDESRRSEVFAPVSPLGNRIAICGAPSCSVTYTTAFPSGVQLGDDSRNGPSASVVVS